MQRWLNRTPSLPIRLLLGALPFLLLLLAYGLASEARLATNPDDKLLPSLTTLGETFARLATEEDKRSGAVLLWADTAASLSRLGWGLLLSALFGLTFGVLNGLIPTARAQWSPLVAVLSMVPPMALLPILFIVFGLGEVSKVVLIVFGIAPFMMRDLQQRIEELPRELLVKAQTLGASTWQILLRVALPQALPRLLDALRLSLGPAWIFLIAAEAIASTDGLGYRIFLVRRYLAMDVILPYVMWITLLAFALDRLLAVIRARAFPWYDSGRAA